MKWTPLPRVIGIVIISGFLPGVMPNWAAQSAYLRKDTPVALRLKQSLTSAEARTNDRVEFEVTEDVKLGDLVAISAGSLAWGTVAQAVPRARLMKSGKLAIDIKGVCLADGGRATLRGSPSSREGMSAREPDKDPSTNVLALPALPVLLFVYGKDVTIPEGRGATAYVSQTVIMDPTRLVNPVPNTTCDREPVPTASGAEALSTILIRSTPGDAEVTVDGKYLGNAPATLKLPAGDHVISATAPGRKTWERSVHLTPGGEVSITATLEERPPIGGGVGPVPTAPVKKQP